MSKYKVIVELCYEIETEQGQKEITQLVQDMWQEKTKELTLKRKSVRVTKQRSEKVVLAEFTPEKILSEVKKEGKKHRVKKELVVDGETYRVNLNSNRFLVFKKSSVCASCGLKGTKMLLELNQNDKSPHFNLYAEENGRLILMTKDHIQPLSRHGLNELSNYQCYCSPCNSLKGNDDLTNKEVYELRKLYNLKLPKAELTRVINEAREKMLNVDRLL